MLQLTDQLIHIQQIHESYIENKHSHKIIQVYVELYTWTIVKTFILFITFQISITFPLHIPTFILQTSQSTGDVFGFFFIILGIQNIYDKKQIKVDLSVPHLIDIFIKIGHLECS